MKNRSDQPVASVPYNCIVVLGPTASGKTALACRVSQIMGGEIISADSRQVYKQLDLGTGKDLHEYEIKGEKIPYHLINIREPNEQLYLHEFVEELEKTFLSIRAQNKLPIICGGTGLYLDALHKDFRLTAVPENAKLREELKDLNKSQLLTRLNQFPEKLIEQVDRSSGKRITRGIEIAGYLLHHPKAITPKPLPYVPYYLGISLSTEERRKRISERLQQRLNSGLVEEVKSLLKNGLTHERLQKLGLEYKFVSLYIQNKISRPEMTEQLQTAIFQFAKRQMTWFRKMEKEGIRIRWLQPGYAFKTLHDELRALFDGS